MKMRNLAMFLHLIIFSGHLISSSILNNLSVPNGFEISILAKNLDSPRQITETSMDI